IGEGRRWHRGLRTLPQLDEGATRMLMTIATLLIILWLLGMITSYTLGGFIHILLVLAIVVLLINVISGRRTGL
ncbi:MAG TPA: lmo0937 family membrane protein, partial [Terriglobales bacterium]|nr:lmo0937 family membrane protein [Terriglobales bacterium]